MLQSILVEDSSKSPPDVKELVLTRIPCNDGWGCIQTLAVGQVGGSSPDLVSRRTLGLAAGRYNGQVSLTVAVKALGRARNTFVVFFSWQE